MASTIPILWSDDIKVDIVTPLAILRAQTGPISQMTRGLLEAEVSTATSESGRARHQLDLIAPVLKGYRHSILAATHEKDLVYPVKIQAECFDPEPVVDFAQAIAALGKPANDSRRTAQTEQEFIDIVSQVLHSGEVRSIIQSLIARSNEVRDRRSPPAEDETEDAEEEGSV